MRNVLVVDDDDDIRQYVRAVLDSSGYSTTTVATYAEGRDALEFGAFDAVAKIVPDKEWYEEGENGHATLEYYNPRPYSVTISLPGRWRVDGVYSDGEKGGVAGGFIDWMNSTRTLAPGEVLRVAEFYFKTPRAGSFILEGMGAKATVLVLPASP